MMKAIRVGSQEVFFEDLQPKNLETLRTVLLVHGAGGSHLSWRRQFDDLPRHHVRLIAVDLPGHGMSEGRGEAAIGAYTQYVVALMESLDLHDVVLGGHSMGGAIALDIALKNSGRLSGLLLVGTGARLRVLPAIFAIIREDFEVAVQGMTNFTFGSTAPSGLVEEEKQLLANTSADVILKDFTACDSFDVMAEVGSIKLPALIVCGTEDRLTPPKYSEFLHEKMPASEMILVDKCGHMPMLEQSDGFNECVSSFLARI
ncbi:MAG: alpha/beta hydrolase [Candidatus Abyssobacteria bacterium SURF_17]|uniref:Alpha/beta hydrolase n=1 Tax=Candidatus Abyssobacteria bacterium SURF_17 TaxID=2093361 RepID=A0A419ERA4_9BACT|nr:MAG: alpha/beta hydrolase [Candidatus Abyssubacteria bacterium SURF_17]